MDIILFAVVFAIVAILLTASAYAATAERLFQEARLNQPAIRACHALGRNDGDAADIPEGLRVLAGGGASAARENHRITSHPASAPAGAREILQPDLSAAPSGADTILLMRVTGGFGSTTGKFP